MANTSNAIIQLKPLYLSRIQAAVFLSLSPSMLDKLVAQGNMPRPRKLSAGRSAWNVSELEAWGNNLPVSDLLPPKNSGYGRAGAQKGRA